VLSVPRQSPQNTVHLYSIHANHCKTQALQPTPPERTLLYQTVAEHYETWLELASAGQFDGQGDHHSPKPYVRKAFAKYLECGIFVHGFARARCGDCGLDYFVAFSCKGRGVCPSCTTRRMVETAAHLTDHVFPRLPVRQWVLSVPKRLRYFMQRDGPVLNMVLRIFLRVIAQNLHANCPGAANADKASLHIGAVAFIHRFGSSLNEHVHFHVCVVDGVFEEVAGEGSADAPMQVSASGVVFHPASGIDAHTVAPVQTTLQKRILRAFVARGLLENCDAKDMLAYQHSGFSVDAGVCIEAHDRAALERLLRYCARPPFSMERLRKEGSKLVYRCAKQRSEPASDKRGAKADELHLTPLELIERIAALVPPTTYPPAPLLWRAGTQLAAEGSGYRAGPACCGATSHGGDCTTWRGRGRTWGGGTWQSGPTSHTFYTRTWSTDQSAQRTTCGRC
jgi:hypothetical protein